MLLFQQDLQITDDIRGSRLIVFGLGLRICFLQTCVGSMCGFQTTNQQRYYERCAKASVDQFLNGYNATIIAFGQVGSGKTYTITGDTKVTPGI